LQSICHYFLLANSVIYLLHSNILNKFIVDIQTLFSTYLAIRILTSGSIVHFDVRAFLQIIQSQFAEILQNYRGKMHFTLGFSVKYKFIRQTIRPYLATIVRLETICASCDPASMLTFSFSRGTCRSPIKILAKQIRENQQIIRSSNYFQDGWQYIVAILTLDAIRVRGGSFHKTCSFYLNCCTSSQFIFLPLYLKKKDEH